MNEQISVIVPVYNVELYIKKCLESLIHQTYTNLQIILVDDGSTDKSGVICDEYAKVDERIQVIHQKNAGVSKARNVGLSIAEGKYVAFCDADDWIEPDMYEYLYNLLRFGEYTIASCGAWIETSEERTAVGYACRDILYLNTQEALAAMHVGCETNAWIWTKLFLKNAINNLRFDENLKVCEDYVFECDAIMECGGMICGTDTKYHYVQRKSSVSNNGYTSEYEKGVEVVRKTIDGLSRDYPVIKKELQSKYVLELMGILTAMIKGNNIDYQRVREIQKIIRTNLKNYIFTNGVKIHLKGSAVVICVNFHLFAYVYRKNKKFG